MVTLNPQGSKPHFGSKQHMQVRSHLEFEVSSLSCEELGVQSLKISKEMKEMVEMGVGCASAEWRERERREESGESLCGFVCVKV